MLWRHGQTAWNLDRRFQGSTDIELTDTGVAQARYAAPLLAALKPDAILSSDLARAAATAESTPPLIAASTRTGFLSWRVPDRGHNVPP